MKNEENNSIWKLYLIVSKIKEFTPSQSTFSLLESISTASVYETIVEVLALSKRVQQELRNSTVPAHLYESAINNINSVFVNNFFQLQNPSGQLSKDIKPETVEALKHIAYTYSLQQQANGIPPDELENAKALLSELRTELETLAIDDGLKTILRKHLIKAEEMVLKYQLYGKEFLDDLLTDYIGTAVLTRNSIPTESTFSTKFWDWCSKITTLLALVDSGKKVLPYIAPVLLKLSQTN